VVLSASRSYGREKGEGGGVYFQLERLHGIRRSV